MARRPVDHCSQRGTSMAQRSARPAVRLTLLFGLLLSLALSGAVSGTLTANAADRGKNPGTYTNPLRPRIPGDGVVESCADPTVIHGQVAGDTTW
jgi:arabinan endo-1,5-alpha-L-arabinosidase